MSTLNVHTSSPSVKVNTSPVVPTSAVLEAVKLNRLVIDSPTCTINSSGMLTSTPDGRPDTVEVRLRSLVPEFWNSNES